MLGDRLLPDPRRGLWNSVQNQPVLGGDKPGLGVRVGGEKSARWATERHEKAERWGRYRAFGGQS